MNRARLALAALVSWVVYVGVNFLVHAVLLKNVYLQHASAMRPEVEASAILPLGFGFALLGFFAFAYLYARSCQGGGVGEGIQFGLLAGVILCCFATIWDYMVWPVSPTLAALWMVVNLVEFALYGAIVGVLYQPLYRPYRVPLSV
jgi:hypothetical protein